MKLLVCAFVVVLMLGSCANPAPPSGGPRDTIPPEVSSSLPARSLFVTAPEVTFEFSEWVDRSSFEQAFSITPRAAIEFDWSGREVTVSFVDSLQSETTYVLDIGPAFRDLRGNRIPSTISIPFSTGGVLDSLSFSGRVVSRFENIGVMLFNVADTISRDQPSTPVYYKGIGPDGTFSFQALKQQEYRVVAVQDVYGDGVFTPFVDAGTLGEAPKYMPAVGTNELPLFWLKDLPDTIAPTIRKLGSAAKNSVFVRASESLSSYQCTFEFVTPSGTTIGDVRRALNADSTEVRFYHDDFEPGDSIILSAVNLVDVAGNIRVLEPMDTLVISENVPVLRLVHPQSRRSATIVSKHKPLQLEFSEAISEESLASALRLLDASDTPTPLQLHWLDAATCVVRPNNVDFGVDYTLELDWNKVQSYSSAPADTAISFRVRFEDPRNLGTLNISISDSLSSSKTQYVVGLFSQAGIEQHTATVVGAGEHTLSGLPVGRFHIRVVRDENRNGTYDQGNVFKFQPAEAVRGVAQPVTIKERWITEGASVEF